MHKFSQPNNMLIHLDDYPLSSNHAYRFDITLYMIKNKGILWLSPWQSQDLPHSYLLGPWNEAICKIAHKIFG